MTSKNSCTPAIVILLIILSSLAYGGAVKGEGQIDSTGKGVANGILTFTLAQPAVVAGAPIPPTTTVNCYTDTAGKVVGMPNPEGAPLLSAKSGSGSLPGGNYHVRYTWGDGSGETAASAEAVGFTTQRGALIVETPANAPVNAIEWRIYIGSARGTETLQATLTAPFRNYSQSMPLAAGAKLPATNTSACTLRANDGLNASYAAHNVKLASTGGAAAPNLYYTVTDSNVNGFLYVDGTTFTTVQAAITAACNAGGGVVYIPPGTYAQNSSFTLCSNLNLIGAGRAQADVVTCPTTITTTMTSGDLFPVSNMNMVRLSDFCIKNTGSSGANAAIHLQWGQFVTAERLYIQGPFAVGIQLNPAVGTASTIFNNFSDIHITGLASNGIGCLLDSGSSQEKVINNNYFENVNCTGGTGGIGLKTAGGVNGFSFVNENVFKGGQFNATSGTAVLVSGGSTTGSVRDLTFIGGDMEGSTTGLNIQGSNDGVRCFGCNISANTTNVTTSGPQSRHLILGNIGVTPQKFAIDQSGNLSANALCIAPAACDPGNINAATGYALEASGSVVATLNNTSWQFNKPAILFNSTFSALGTPVDGTIQFCSDCTVTDPCAGSGTGALAKRMHGAWVCN